MATLTGKKVKNTYLNLVQLDNGQFQDGDGNAVSASISELSGSFSGSFEGDGSGLTGVISANSASFASRITSQENFSSSLDNTYATDAELASVSSSLALETAQLLGFSASLDATYATDAQLDSVSSSLALETAQLLGFSASLDATYATDAQLSTVSASAASTSDALDTRLTAQEGFSSSLDATFATDAELTSLSSSIVPRIEAQESFSSSLDATFATDAEVTSVSSSLAADISSLSSQTSSYAATDIANTFSANQTIDGQLTVSQRQHIGNNHWDTNYAKAFIKEVTSEVWIEQNNASDDGGDLVFYKTRGYPNGETHALANDNLFKISGRALLSGSTNQGVDLTVSDYGEPVLILGNSTDIASGSVGGELIFRTQEAGKFNTVDRLVIQDRGHVSASAAISASAFHGSGTDLTGITLQSDFTAVSSSFSSRVSQNTENIVSNSADISAAEASIGSLNAATSSYAVGDLSNYQEIITSASPSDNTYIIPSNITCFAGGTTFLTGSIYEDVSIIRIGFSGSNGTHTLTLPDCTTSTNTYRSIRFISNNGVDNQHQVVLQPSASQALDGAAGGFTFNRSYEGVMVWSDGTEWFQIQAKNV